MTPVEPCDVCLRRAWLLGRLAGHLEAVRGRITELLELGDEELIAAVGGRHQEAIRSEFDRLDTDAERRRYATAGVAAVCRCELRFPAKLHDLAAPPAVLHLAGDEATALAALAAPAVAIVGARRASSYGVEFARSLARALASAGITVISGMAYGIDSAAHEGALAAGATVAVLPGGAGRPYPAGRRNLYRRIVAGAGAVAELPPGGSVRRWMFAARNRLIVALADMTVVVEAGEGSGALITASYAANLGRRLGAVPGQVTSPLARGPHQLIAAGARLVGGPQDVLDELFGAAAAELPAAPSRPPVEAALEPLLQALAQGRSADEAIAVALLSAGEGLAALAALELGGYIRREPGGRFTVLS